jgi:hypothetical protein
LIETPVDGRLGRRRSLKFHLQEIGWRCRRRIFAGLTKKIFSHRRRFTSHDSAVSQSPST